MRFDQPVEIVGCHAEGEVGDVIVGGVAVPPGNSVWEQSRWIAEDQSLRNYVLNEPRGGVFRHVNLLVPATRSDAHMGFIIMEPEDTPPMSGSNTICVATVLLERGIVEMKEPVTKLVLEAPGGLVRVSAECREGKVRRVTFRNVPSFVDKLGTTLDVGGLGTIRASTAYGGDTFVIVDSAELGFSLTPDEANDIVAMGTKITAAANDQLGFVHPENRQLTHISFCQMAAAIEDEGGRRIGRNAVVIRPGKIDRSPTGTGVSARLALLHAMGEADVGDSLVARSLIGSEFIGRIESETKVGATKAIHPVVSGRAWIYEHRKLVLDPGDPWPAGYRIADTWPRMP